MDRKKAGMVYLIGAGPGNPELMTLKGRRLISSCDAIVYDHLASRECLSWASKDCRLIYVGKKCGCHSMKQEDINACLVDLALAGLTVVRLKGGDPFVFGRGGEEILALQEHAIPFEAVPGVTSAVAVPEWAGIPVTHRGLSRSFHVITGHMGEKGETLPEDIRRWASLPGTFVFLMGRSHLGSIARELMEGGMSPQTPAAVIEQGTLPGQRTVRGPLESIEKLAKEERIGTPAIIVVGETAACQMRWEGGRLPLSGICAGLIGTPSFTDRLKKALEEQGGWGIPLLQLELLSYERSEEMRQAYQSLENYTWLLFTSANGVDLFFHGLKEAGRDFRALGHLQFAVIGPGTEEALKKQGFLADAVASPFCARGLGELMAERAGVKDRLLIPRAKEGSRELNELLDKASIPYDEIPLYEVRPARAGLWKNGEENHCGFQETSLDYLIFASASGVRGWIDRGGDSWLRQIQGSQGGSHKEPCRKQVRIACIGRMTARELEKNGIPVHAVAEDYHIPGLLRALEEDIS